MQAIIKDGSLKLIHNGEILLCMESTKDKNTFESNSLTDSEIVNNIIKFIIKHGKDAKLFIRCIFDNYASYITVIGISTNLKLDRIKVKELLTSANEYSIIKKYGSCWKVPKENLVYIHNYLESLK